MTASSVGFRDRLKKALNRTCKTNAYQICDALEAGALMFIEATPEEQAKKMRIVKQFYK